MGPFEYILIVLVSLSLIAMIILIVVVVNKRSVQTQPSLDLTMHEKIQTLQSKIDQLNKDIADKVELTLAKNAKEEIQADGQNYQRLSAAIAEKLAELNKEVKDALVGANKSQGETLTHLGKQIEGLQNANKEVSRLGESVNDLAKVISGNNQKRGQFGEFLLTSILDHIFESTKDLYSTQYDLTFNGTKVRPDAVIFLPKDKGNILPIDAKFPYANYLDIFNEEGKEDEARLRLFKDDVKRKIDEIADKYIIKGVTTAYALCYFPSDEIYNYVYTRLPGVATYARKRSVVLVSPATLQPVLHTLKSLAIEYKRSQKLEELNKLIAALGNDFRLVKERWTSIEKGVNALKNHVDHFAIPFNRLSKRFDGISDVSIEDDETQ